MFKFEFINRRKVVRTFTDVEEAAKMKDRLIKVYNAFDFETDDCLRTFWNDVEKVAEAVIDPFMPLTIKIYQNDKLVTKIPVWKNTVK